MAIQARTEFASALNQVCSERGVEPEIVIESIKQAILAAYRKDYGDPEGIDVGLDANSGEVKLNKGKKDVTPAGFGRIAAQTAKQVILQRIREAEKDAIMAEYSNKVGTIVSGIIQRISGPIVTVNLGKAEGIMPPSEQSHKEKYFVNQRLKLYIVGIKEGARGEEIIVSRSHPGLLEGLFKQEVPEIAQGSVEIKVVAREGGSRTKIAVASGQLGVDPVGSCVGQKGVRVQAVMNELGDEKIDIIAYQQDPAEFIKAALSPAKELQVKINEKEKSAQVTVPDDQLSLAIGKEGQNVRLAAKLTGYKIDIRGKSGTPKEVEAKEKKAQEDAKKALGMTDEEVKKPRAQKSFKEEKLGTLKTEKKPEEKGTTEKSSSQIDQPVVDQSNQPADDKTSGDLSKVADDQASTPHLSDQQNVPVSDENPSSKEQEKAEGNKVQKSENPTADQPESNESTNPRGSGDSGNQTT